MKRKTLLLTMLLAFAAPWAAMAQTTYTASDAGIIGTGMSGTYEVPMNLYYKSFVTQQIYTADEIGLEGKNASIKTISFQYHGTTSYTSKEFTLYLGNTTKSEFTSNTDWITTGDMSNMGSYTITTGNVSGGWVTITLNSTFSYNGTNLVVCLFDDNQDDYPGTSSSTWRYSTTSNYKTMFYRTDNGTAPTITSSTSGTRTQNRPNIKLNIGGTSVTTSSGVFYDSGGINGNYSDYEDYIWTFNPATTGAKIALDLTNLTSESNWDYFRIYDGTSTSATRLLEQSGSLPSTTHYEASNSNGALTVWWHSDGSNTKSGFAANITEVSNSYITEISSVAEWEAFCAAVNGGHSYSGETVTLANDISEVTTMCGTSSSTPFKGTFDGQGNKITLNLSATENACAPFRYINDATIQNLKVDGNVNGNGYKQLSGLVGYAAGGSSTIYNCSVSATLTTNFSGDSSHGGLVMQQSNGATLTIEGCAFTGTFNFGSSYKFAGFVGWREGNYPSLTITNCMFAPASMTYDNSTYEDNNQSQNFMRNGSNSTYYFTLTNSYYTTAVRTSTQGKQARTVTLAANPTTGGTVSLGTSTDTYSASGITAYSTGIKYNNTFYAGSGDQISVTATANAGYDFSKWDDNNTNNPYNYTMPNSDASLTAIFVTIPYTIASVEDWNAFCDAVNRGHDYSDETVTMTADVGSADDPVTTICGDYTDDNNYKAFKGTFDGGGHTLYVNLTDMPKFSAPFKIVEGATIQNLRTDGSITGRQSSSSDSDLQQGRVISGLVAISRGTTNIIGCSSSMAIASLFNTGADVVLAGLVASTKGGNLTVEGCAFEGTMNTIITEYYNHNCGIVGYPYKTNSYNSATVTVRNTVFAPANLNTNDDSEESNTIARKANNTTPTITNCYYTYPLTSVTANIQGKELHTITGDTDVTVAMSGTETDYGASGIKAYKNGSTQLPGLVYNGTVIAGNGENVGLTLGYTGTLNTGYAAVYSADHGTLSGSSNPYTLAMDAYNTIISATSEQMPLRVGNGTNATYLTWEEFTANVQNTTNYSGKTIYLEKDITVTSIVPSNCWNSTGSNMVFKGTFDGQGHTITINHTATQDFTGLFRYTYGATIKNLRLEGTITSNQPNTASLIGMSQGTNNVENVISNVTINSTATGVAGMIAGVSNKVYFRGCAFTGQLIGTSSGQNGGFVGRYWYDETHSYTNCLFAPSSISSGLTGVATFDVYGGSSFSNSYYTQAFGTEQGIQAYSVTGASPVNVTRSGSANTTYNVSGIAAYTGSTNKGLNFTQGSTTTIYAGSGETVALTLSGASTYEANNGTLEGSGSSYTLTMAASNTVISSSISCAAPTNLRCDRYTPTSATLSWTRGGDETQWHVQCWSDPAYEDQPYSRYADATSNTYVLDQLTEGTTYSIKVRAVCDNQNDVWSDWSNTITVTPGTMKFTFTNNSGSGDSKWDTDTNWSPVGLPTIDDDVEIRANATIRSGYTALANEISFYTNPSTGDPDGSITIEDGGQLQHNNDGVVVTIERVIPAYDEENEETNLGYKIISFPVSGIYQDDECIEGLLTANPYDFYTFEYNNLEENVYLEWRHVNNDDVLDPYKGYLYASQNGTTISVTGEVAPSVNQDYHLDYVEGVAPFNGWKLVGNPFVCNAYLTANGGNLDFYEIEDYTQSRYAEFSLNDNTVAIPPMGGVMVRVKANDNLVYSRTAAPTGSKGGILNMNVNKLIATKDGASTETIDRARLRFGQGRNLEKLQLNPRHTKLYIPEDGNDYAVYYAEGAGTIPVNFKAQDNGSYTLSFSTEDVSFNYLHLIDNMNGNDVDLLQTPYYTFDAKSTDFASRFTLVFATGSSTGSDTFAFFNNGVWIINNPSTGSGAEATLQVVDVLGHILSSETISGSCSKAINVAPGVYMLRLVNGDKVKVQKIVVRR